MTPPDELPNNSPHVQATGAAYPSARGPSASRPEQSALDVSAGVDAVAFPAGGLHPDVDAGPPYAVKDGAFHGVKAAYAYGCKLAWHAHDRMEERTPFHKSHADLVQSAVDLLDLDPGAYHLPLRHKDGSVAGYAQFKTVPNRPRPVLATVLGPQMKPGGTNIEHLLKTGHEPETNATMDKPPFGTSPQGDQLDPRPSESSAKSRAAPRVGDRSAPLDYALRKGFNDLRMTDTNTVDQGGIAPETGAEG